jgi:hypothetical protein
MGRFVVWVSHRGPDSAHLTGFRGLFTDNGISADVSAMGMSPVPAGNRQVAYRAMIEELANALLGTEEDPLNIGESDQGSGIIFQGASPFVVPQARPATARVSGDGVEMTVYASVHGRPPTDYQILLRMKPDEARQLAGDLTAGAASADLRGR